MCARITLTQESETSEEIRVGNAGRKAGMRRPGDLVFVEKTSYSFQVQGSTPCLCFAASSLKAAGESDLV